MPVALPANLLSPLFGSGQALLVGVLMAIACARASAAEPQVVPADGDPFAARLQSASARQLQFRTTGQPRTLPPDALMRYGHFIEARRGPLWVLNDGGVLVADLVELGKEQLQGDSLLFGEVAIPLGAVAGVAVQLPADRQRKDALLSTIRTASGDVDRVLLDNGDELAGILEAIADDSLTLLAETGRITVQLSRVAAVIFNPSLAERAKPTGSYFVAGFSDGSRLLTSELSTAEELLKFVSAGQSFSAPLIDLAALQRFGGRAVYLSDLPEFSFKHVPYLQWTWPLKKDENVLGHPLRAGGQRYLKGLGMHSAARVAYRLDQPYQRLQCQLAIDDSAGNRGSTVCSIFVDDGSGEWQPRYTSPILRGGEAPLDVSLDLSGVKAISLLCDFADHGTELDHVDWLDARVIR